MDGQVARQSVRQFQERTGFPGKEEHCFAPWYLNFRYHLSEVQAMEQASDGSYDFGIDAFHVDGAGDVPTLVLIQAKYSESIEHARKGFKDLERVLPELRRALEHVDTAEPVQNKVLVNLRGALNRLSDDSRKRVELQFQVLHLCSEDSVIVAEQLRAPMGRLQEVVSEEMEAWTCRIGQVGPRDLGPQEFVVVPASETPLRIDGAHEFSAGTAERMFTGVGRLADLVDLYKSRRDQLFSRNVRYYLSSRTNTEKGPAGKMRATLKQMCVEESLAPERFAMFHNGVTIFSRRVTVNPDGALLREPYVLNGCQTIKNAFLFRYDPALQRKIQPELWDRVAVPVRIIETADQDLIRVVTVNNNRQNAMSAHALRANDPVQIRLEQRFRDRGIVYERQEGAFDNIWASQPELLEEVYENTRGTWVDILDLARAIAATAGELNAALHANNLFESDAAYERCFDERRRLQSITFLTFLQNLHDVLGLVLKKDLNLDPSPGAPRPARCTYHVICLLTRYLAREEMSEFVVDWGTRLHHKEPEFREAVRRVLNSNKSRIRLEVSRHFMDLDSARANHMNAAFTRCAAALKLKDNIDPFVAFATLDDEVESSAVYDD